MHQLAGAGGASLTGRRLTFSFPLADETMASVIGSDTLIDCQYLTCDWPPHHSESFLVCNWEPLGSPWFKPSRSCTVSSAFHLKLTLHDVWTIYDLETAFMMQSGCWSFYRRVLFGTD